MNQYGNVHNSFHNLIDGVFWSYFKSNRGLNTTDGRYSTILTSLGPIRKPIEIMVNRNIQY